MSKTTLTQKHTGRIYLSMDREGFTALYELVESAEARSAEQGVALSDSEKKIVHLVTNFNPGGER